MKKSHNKRNFRFKMIFCFVAMFVILLPHNYLGMPISPKSTGNESFSKWNKTETTESMKQNDNRDDNSHKKLNLGSFLGKCVWMLVILTVSTSFFGGIIAFLNDQPLNRQCLLLYLYKDLITLILARVWMISLEIGWYQANNYEKGTSLGKLQANIIAVSYTHLTLPTICSV